MAVVPSRASAPIAVEVADRTRRHIAVRLLPFLFILYITNYLDRTNLAWTSALGMSRDLGFSDQVFGLGAGIFFFSYVALQIPGALLVELWSARRMVSATMIGSRNGPAMFWISRLGVVHARRGERDSMRNLELAT